MKIRNVYGNIKVKNGIKLDCNVLVRSCLPNCSFVQRNTRNAKDDWSWFLPALLSVNNTLSLLYWLEKVVGLTSSMTVQGEKLVYPVIKSKKKFIIVTNHLGFLEWLIARIKWKNISLKIKIIQWNMHTHKHMEFEPGILPFSPSHPRDGESFSLFLYSSV